MNTNPLISIIIPVYNCAASLPRCLDSLLRQTFSDFEIIALDDSSVDSSLHILQKYAAADKRVRVISDGTNLGPGQRRNQGIGLAGGKYIMMVDADDWLEADACARLVEKSRQDSYDVICFNAWIDHKNESTPVEYYHVREEFCGTWSYVQPYIFQTPFHSWHWFYRRDFLQKFQLEYPSYHIFEDEPFILGVLLNAEKILFCPQKFYHYVQNEESLVNKVSEKFMCIFDVFADIDRILAKAGQSEYFAPQVKKWKQNHLQFCSCLLSPGKRSEFLQKIKESCPFVSERRLFRLWKISFCKIPLLSAYQPQAGYFRYRLLGLPIASIRIRRNRIKFYVLGLPLLKITKTV